MNIINYGAQFALSFSHDTIIIPLLIGGFIWWDREMFYNAICLVLVSIIVNYALKITFQIPLSPSLGKEGFAFPSGHMQTSTILYGWIAYQTQKMAIKLLTVTLLIAIALSLVYFGYHNYYDILGGVFCALSLMALYIISLNHAKPTIGIWLIDSLRKSKNPAGFLGKKPSPGYGDVHEGASGHILTTKSPTRWTYAGSLLFIATLLLIYIALKPIHHHPAHVWLAYYALLGFISSAKIFNNQKNLNNIVGKLLTSAICSITIITVYIVFYLKPFNSPLYLQQLPWVVIGFIIPCSSYIANITLRKLRDN